jgi:type IV fimbrial biogenesis protein FimT
MLISNYRPGVQRTSGFTLIEALVVLSIIIVTSAIVIPGMSGFIFDSRVSGNVNEFIGAVTLARTEAVKRGGLVTVCISSNADQPAATCSGGNDWAAGWIVYAEDSTTTSVGSRESGEPIILRRGALLSGVAAPASGATSSLTFNSLGEQVGTSTAMLSVDFSDRNKNPRKVCINRNGRVRVMPKADSTVACI